MEITSVSKRRELLSRAPAAIYVITQEDIRRSGAYTLPEALRMVPGMQVARMNESRWAITARGFNAEYSNKLLVLIDGRSVYSPVFSGVFWDMEDIMLEDIHRIEVIRGPGASVWGANAVNGVINVITKGAEATQGMAASSGASSTQDRWATVRYGGKLKDSTHYRIYSKYAYRQPFSDAIANNYGILWHGIRTGIRTDSTFANGDALTIIGEGFNNTVQGSDGHPELRRQNPRQDVTAGSALARWTHRTTDSSGLVLQSYINETRRDDIAINMSIRTIDFDLQHRSGRFNRHDLLWGLGVRSTQTKVAGDAVGPLLKHPQADNLFSGFVQDEFSLIEGVLALTAGTRLERNDYTGFELQPTVRLAWTPNVKHTVWTAGSRAVRTPARFEHQIHVPLGPQAPIMGIPAFATISGSTAFRSEVLRNTELGYRFQGSTNFAIDIATFYNWYSNLRAVRPNMPQLTASSDGPAFHIPMEFANGTSGRGYGTEVAMSWHPAEKLSLQSSYSWLRIGLKTMTGFNPESSQGAAPQHQASTRASYDLPFAFKWDTTAYYVGALKALMIPSYLRLDSRLSRPIGKSLELSMNLQNALDPKHPEFKSEGNTIANEIPRAFFFGLNWRY